MKYKVTYEYRGTVTVEVEADNEKEAEAIGMEEADSYIKGALTVYGVDVKEADP